MSYIPGSINHNNVLLTSTHLTHIWPFLSVLKTVTANPADNGLSDSRRDKINKSPHCLANSTRSLNCFYLYVRRASSPFEQISQLRGKMYINFHFLSWSKKRINCLCFHTISKSAFSPTLLSALTALQYKQPTASQIEMDCCQVFSRAMITS